MKITDNIQNNPKPTGFKPFAGIFDKIGLKFKNINDIHSQKYENYLNNNLDNRSPELNTPKKSEKNIPLNTDKQLENPTDKRKMIQLTTYGNFQKPIERANIDKIRINGNNISYVIHCLNSMNCVPEYDDLLIRFKLADVDTSLNEHQLAEEKQMIIDYNNIKEKFKSFSSEDQNKAAIKIINNMNIMQKTITDHYKKRIL